MNNINIINQKWSRFSKIMEVNPTNKFNLVYFHAFTGSYKNKSYLAKKFQNCNFLGFDMPGHGDTKVVSEEEISIKNYVKLAIEFIVDFDIKKIILFGHSMGGGICSIISNNPLIANRVDKIILESPANPAGQKNYESIIKHLIPDDMMGMKTIGDELFYDPIAFFGNEKNYVRYLNMEFERLKKQTVLKQILEKANQDELNTGAMKAIQNNQTKSLVILGTNDHIIPHQESVTIFSKNKNFDIFSVEKAKHVPFAEHTEIVLAKINNFVNS